MYFIDDYTVFPIFICISSQLIILKKYKSFNFCFFVFVIIHIIYFSNEFRKQVKMRETNISNLDISENIAVEDFVESKNNVETSKKNVVKVRKNKSKPPKIKHVSIPKNIHDNKLSPISEQSEGIQRSTENTDMKK